jgi:hypothetical protein
MSIRILCVAALLSFLTPERRAYAPTFKATVVMKLSPLKIKKGFPKEPL